MNDHQTLIFQSRVLQILPDILRPSIQKNTPHGYTQGYQQGYSTHRYHNTFQSGYQTSIPVGSISESRTTSSFQIRPESSNQECEINSPLPLDETSATSYGTQDEEFDFS